jgi:hypothetical protein
MQPHEHKVASISVKIIAGCIIVGGHKFYFVVNDYFTGCHRYSG